MTGQELGRQFEAELVASVRRLWGEAAAARCKIPDEKRPTARGNGDRPRYYGEVRIADLVVVRPGGRTLWIEAKATSRNAPIATVRKRQWETLRFLADCGHESWLLLNWRTLEPPFVNECLALPAEVALRCEGRSIGLAWAREHGEPLRRIAVRGAGGWGWDLRMIAAHQGGRR